MKPELYDMLFEEPLPLMWARSPLREKCPGGYPQRRGNDLVWRRLPQRSYPTGPNYKGAGDGEMGHPSPKWGLTLPIGEPLWKKLLSVVMFYWFAHHPHTLSIVTFITNSINCINFYLPILAYYFILPNNFHLYTVREFASSNILVTWGRWLTSLMARGGRKWSLQWWTLRPLTCLTSWGTWCIF